MLHSVLPKNNIMSKKYFAISKSSNEKCLSLLSREIKKERKKSKGGKMERMKKKIYRYWKNF